MACGDWIWTTGFFILLISNIVFIALWARNLQDVYCVSDCTKGVPVCLDYAKCDASQTVTCLKSGTGQNPDEFDCQCGP